MVANFTILYFRYWKIKTFWVKTAYSGKGNGTHDKSYVQIKAEELIAQAKTAEAVLTDLFIKWAEKIKGLDFRLKSVESLTGKRQSDGINTEMKQVLH